MANIELAAEIAGRVLSHLRGALRSNETKDRSPEEGKAYGKSLRETVPRSVHANWQPAEGRPDPVDLLREQGRTRLQELLPIRYERMSASPFAFYRGSAVVMASDLATTPTTGITVQDCGDAHISNFGLFSSPERRTVFDINDFDETARGPWEWDVKRLATSVEICGRDRGFSEEARRSIVLACAQGYREGMRTFAQMGNLAVWYAHLDVDSLQNELRTSGELPKEERAEIKVAERAVEKAKRKDNGRAIAKLTEVVDGQLRIVSDPPIVVPLRELAARSGQAGQPGQTGQVGPAQGEDPSGDSARGPAKEPANPDMAKLVAHVLAEYKLTLAPERRRLVEQYEGVDIARKVVGVGSVGTRAWIVVMRGTSNDDALVLQVKEAQESVLERFAGKSPYREQGQRVVEGQRAIQATSDMLLGWCRLPGEDGRPKDYYVRQLWDGKGSIDLARLSQQGLADLARACGWTLAHAHARTGDRFAIAGYLGKKDTFDRAIARFAVAYADQNQADYERFMRAYEAGEL